MSEHADFPQAPSDLPFITGEQMRVVDELMIHDFGVSLLQMMENAGRNLAELAVKRFLNDDPLGKRVIVLAGPGGNGGGGLAAARHLHNTGADVEIVLAAPSRNLSAAAAAQLTTCEASEIGITEFKAGSLPRAGLIVDAILGYGGSGDPRGTAAGLIDAANAHPAPVLANDIPSGIDASSGSVGRPSIRADTTLTIALPKTGLKEAHSMVGTLFVSDISVPPELYANGRVGDGAVTPFAAHIMQIW